MYAIVEIAGQQFKVMKDEEIFVHRLEAEAGTKVEFDQVLLLDQDGKISVGKPYVEGSKITAKVLDNTVRGDKVVVFKKKKRKGFQKETGHRQDFSKILIENITVKGGSKEKKAKKEAEEAAE